MSYEIVYGKRALDRAIEFLEEHNAVEDVIEQINEAMERLAKQPVKLSSRSTVPYPHKGQRYKFSCFLSPGVRVGFQAHFMYGSDESTLHVFDLVPGGPYLML